MWAGVSEWRVPNYAGSTTQFRWSTKRALAEERSWAYISRFEAPWAKLEESAWTWRYVDIAWWGSGHPSVKV